MSETPSENTGIHAQYAAQVTADLERNTKEQERIAAEIAALEEQLLVLRRDHDLLLSVQQALGVEAAATAAATTAATTAAATATPEEHGGSQDGQAAQVPAPRPAPAERKKRLGRKKATADKAEAGTSRTRGRRGKKAESAESAPAASPAGAAAPTLVTLVRDYLGQQSEPRSAAEIAAALSERLPDRTVKANVVRTTVEGLVAKGAAHRTKQGSSVFYVAADDTAGRPAEEAEPAAV